jgi:hypothetical protein
MRLEVTIFGSGSNLHNLWRALSSWKLRRVAWQNFRKVSKKTTASIFREKKANQVGNK